MKYAIWWQEANGWKPGHQTNNSKLYRFETAEDRDKIIKRNSHWQKVSAAELKRLGYLFKNGKPVADLY